MDESTKQNLKTQFASLPTEVQKAISDVNLSVKLQEIVKNNKLLLDQADGLETETVLVLIGLEPLENYTNNLIKKAGMTNIQAAAVAHDVNELIFKSVREALKTISDEIMQTKAEATHQTIPSQNEIVSTIENPESSKMNENSISLSSLKSNSLNPETHESIDRGVEIKINNLPEIAPEAMLPMVSSLSSKPTEPYHENVSPVKNIVESKLSDEIVLPKQNIIIEEKTKLPEKPKMQSDAYREPII